MGSVDEELELELEPDREGEVDEAEAESSSMGGVIARFEGWEGESGGVEIRRRGGGDLECDCNRLVSRSGERWGSAVVVVEVIVLLLLPRLVDEDLEGEARVRPRFGYCVCEDPLDDLRERTEERRE